MTVKFFVADELPKFQFTIRDEDGNVVDLSSPDLASAQCYIRKDDAASNMFSDSDTDVTIINKATGRLDYAMPTGGITAAGSYSGQLELTFGSDKQMTERFRFQVEEDLKPP